MVTVWVIKYSCGGERLSASCSQAVHARQPLGQKPEQTVHLPQTLLSLSTTRSTLWTWRRAEEEFQVRPNAQWQRYLFRHDHPGVHQESRPHQGQSKSKRQDARFSRTHTVEKDAGDNVVEPDKEHLSCKGDRQRHLVRGNSTCYTSSTHKW